jgi:hypothetical protein
LTSEQLLATRATLWRHKAEPLLTLDDAQSWLLQTGLCLFLPRKAQIPAPAPSFVEACLGETNPTPPRAAIETAKGLLARLIESNSALPLNLLGTPADHPDFLVSLEALPFVYALRGDRDWKQAPGTGGANRVSPLIHHVWTLLESRGVLTAAEIQEELGKELTEAAVLRALHELWASLRVVPLYQGDGQETLWEPLQSRHQKAIVSGAGMSQITALSVLASVYLQSVVAASGDDCEAFLSPLASRSKVREVIRGLSATRQLSLVQMETESLLYVEGSLPEFPEAERPVPDLAESAIKQAKRPHPTSPERLAASLRRSVAGSAPRPAYKRPAVSDVMRTAEGAEKRPARSVGGGGFRPAAGARSFKPRATPVERSEPGTGLRPDGTPKKTRWRDLPGGRPDQKGKPARFGPRKTEGSGEGEAARPAPRREAGSYRPAAGAKPSFAAKPAFGKKPSFDKKPPFGGKPSFDRKPMGDRGSARPPFRPATGRPTSGRPSLGRPAFDRPYGERPAAAGTRPPARTGAPRFGSRPESGRPYPRPQREDGASPSRSPREGAPTGDRKYTPRSARAGGFSPARPRAGESRPYSPRPGRTRTGAPGTREGAREGGIGPARPYSGASRPPSGRPPGAKPFNRTGSSFKPSAGARPGSSGFKPAGAGFKPGGRSASGPPRSGLRPGFGQGSRPGAGSGAGLGSRPGGARFGAGPGRPRPASGTTGGAKPGGRPPAKFKKRPDSAE